MVVAVSSPSTTTKIGFLSRDPIGFKENQLNLYGYVAASPLVNVDPSGLTFSFVNHYWNGYGRPIDLVGVGLLDLIKE